MLAVPAEALHFSGQSSMDAWTLKDVIERHGWSKYSSWLSQEPVLFLQRVRELVRAFPTWQHVASTGRPPTDERTVLIAMLVRQAFRATFRQLESLLRLLSDFFGLARVPDANTMSEKNRGERFATLLSRFNQFILENLPDRESVIATDATGYSAMKHSWNETEYGLRATEGWIKLHCAVEVVSSGNSGRLDSGNYGRLANAPWRRKRDGSTPCSAAGRDGGASTDEAA